MSWQRDRTATRPARICLIPCELMRDTGREGPARPLHEAAQATPVRLRGGCDEGVAGRSGDGGGPGGRLGRRGDGQRAGEKRRRRVQLGWRQPSLGRWIRWIRQFRLVQLVFGRQLGWWIRGPV